ncbi:MAG: hypothetical protein H7Y32_06095 [Chloroflexales bacterium]|nr:hypothetical protein [Chloroflexales bacterium]
MLFAAAPDTYLDLPSLDYARQAFPQATVRQGLEGFGSLISSRRAEQVIGFVPTFGCRDAQP